MLALVSLRIQNISRIFEVAMSESCALGLPTFKPQLGVSFGQHQVVIKQCLWSALDIEDLLCYKFLGYNDTDDFI